MTGMGAHQSARPTTDVWLTPPYVLEALGGFRSFDLDPCSPEGRPWPTARRHLTKQDNGLILPWHGRVWLNPPYTASVIGKWLGRMADHGIGTALIFARTETEAFHRFVWDHCDALFFFEGRLTFHLPDGRKGSGNAGAPNVLCAYGPDDADVLAGCSLPGQFVPLALRSLVQGFAGGTWLDEVTAVMQRFGEAVRLDTIYRALAASPKAKRNPNYQAKIRQVLQHGPFERVDRGVWRLI